MEREWLDFGELEDRHACPEFALPVCLRGICAGDLRRGVGAAGLRRQLCFRSAAGVVGLILRETEGDLWGEHKSEDCCRYEDAPCTLHI